jgi:hypothetical protein
VELRRIDHIGIVVPGFADGAAAVIEHVAIDVDERFLRRPEP